MKKRNTLFVILQTIKHTKIAWKSTALLKKLELYLRKYSNRVVEHLRISYILGT